MLKAKWTSWLPSHKGVLGINGRNLDLIYTHNDRRRFPNVDDKLRCKALLQAAGIPTPRTYHVVTGPRTLAVWEESLQPYSNFVMKPNTGYGGNGIKLVKRTETAYEASGEEWTAEDVAFHVLQILNGAFSLDNVSDSCYFEETVINHPDLRVFIPEGIEGVGDIRLIYRLDKCVMAMCRLPTKESDGKANLHQGGIGVGIDIATGLSLNGVHHNSVIDRHPESNAILAGQPIPYFKEMLAIGSRVSDLVGLGYIGVDFVCDAIHGPLILEVNARPGLNIQLANQAGLRKRL